MCTYNQHRIGNTDATEDNKVNVDMGTTYMSASGDSVYTYNGLQMNQNNLY